MDWESFVVFIDSVGHEIKHNIIMARDISYENSKFSKKIEYLAHAALKFII